MTSKDQRPVSSFISAALELDGEFQRLEKIAQHLINLDIESDKGLERGSTLMKEADECRGRFGPITESLSKGLAESQAKAAKAVEVISSHAQELQLREEKVMELFGRYKGLAELVGDLTKAVNEIRDSEANLLSAEARKIFADRRPEFDQTLGTLIDHARQLMDDARAANVKDLVRNSDSLRQSLQATRHRFGQWTGEHLN